MKAYIKSKLRPLVGKQTRALLNKVRGIKNEGFRHQTVAELVGKTNPTILEIGCNDGTDTVELMRIMPDANMYCFEPDQRAAARFKERFPPGTMNVRLFEIAIGAMTGRVSFFPSTGDNHTGDFDQAGSIRPPKNASLEAAWLRFKDPVEVTAYRLDDWCAQNGVQEIDFLWMDVQGAEADVIAGAQKTLPNVRYLYTEYSNNELYEGQISLSELLARLPGFEVIARYPGDVLLINTEANTGETGGSIGSRRD